MLPLPAGSATFSPSSRAQVLSLRGNYLRTHRSNVIPHRPGSLPPHIWYSTSGGLDFFPNTESQQEPRRYLDTRDG